MDTSSFIPFILETPSFKFYLYNEHQIYYLIESSITAIKTADSSKVTKRYQRFLIEIILLNDAKYINFMVENDVIGTLDIMTSNAEDEELLRVCKDASDLVLTYSKSSNVKVVNKPKKSIKIRTSAKVIKDDILEETVLQMHIFDAETQTKCCRALRESIESGQISAVQLVDYKNGALIDYLINICNSERDIIKKDTADILKTLLFMADNMVKQQLINKGVISAISNVMKPSASKPWLFCMKTLDQAMRRNERKPNKVFHHHTVQRLQTKGTLYLFEALLTGIDNNVCTNVYKLFDQYWCMFHIEAHVQISVIELFVIFLSIIVGLIGFIYNLLNIHKQQNVKNKY